MINQYMQGRAVDLRAPVQGYAQESFPTAMIYSPQAKRIKTAQKRLNQRDRMARFKMLSSGDQHPAVSGGLSDTMDSKLNLD